LFREEFRDLLFRIVQVSEDASPGRADLDTGRLKACIDPVMAKVALLDNGDEGVNISRIIGAGSQTVFASDASVFVNDHDPIFPLPGRLNRTVNDTGRVIALIAEVGEKVPRNVGILSFFNDFDPRPEDSYRNAIFGFAGDRTTVATDTAS